ncbi:MAG: hypothetical protein JW818_21065 [Pirellulales bacterium]|nr:hypothetical protein [Pirellulales bacterium]
MSNKDNSSQGSGRLSTVVHAGLATVPTVGGTLAALWSDWHTERRFQRVEETINQLRIELASISERFSIDRIGDAEMQFLDAVLERVQSEHREEKRHRFAHLTAAAWTEGLDRPFDEKMAFVRALDEMEELHIQVLVHLKVKKAQNETPSFSAISSELGISHDDFNSRLLPALETLCTNYGFVRRAWGMSSGEGGVLFSRNLSPEGIARGCEHELTELGDRFLRWISGTAESDP